MSFFIYKTRRIYYEELGSGEPVLLLHGNTASSKMFAGIAHKYAQRYKVILIDFLGHGKSDRLERFPVDFWYDEAQQVIALLREKQYGRVNLIGSSGGALAAINIALEAPELVNRVIADSFEGVRAQREFTENIRNDRIQSKLDPGAVMFYKAMHGEGWESVVDNDTDAIELHSREIGLFFHKPLSTLIPDILLTGSKEDEFGTAVDPDYFTRVYGEILQEVGHGKMHLFEHGGHPAMLSNAEDFFCLSAEFLNSESDIDE